MAIRFWCCTKLPLLFVFITEILWQTFWRKNWRFVFDVVKILGCTLPVFLTVEVVSDHWRCQKCWKRTSETTSKNKSTSINSSLKSLVMFLHENTMRFYINSIKHKIKYILAYSIILVQKHCTVFNKCVIVFSKLL